MRAGVRKASGNRQVPWENTSLEGDFFFKPGKSGEAPAQLASLAPALESEPAPGAAAMEEIWTDPVTGMEFVSIPGGCFQMGSPDYEKDHRSNERRHEVCVEGYWIGKYEVTNSQYKKFRPDHGADDKLPVANVSWQDAMHFAQWLSDKSGKKLRLPTEAEWEYAARAGTSTAYFWGDSWEGRHNFATTTKEPVGIHLPNAFGLHDMLGNVWEWTASSYDAGYNGGERQVASLEASGSRVLRGGAWDDGPGDVRSATRRLTPGGRIHGPIGFRLSRTP